MFQRAFIIGKALLFFLSFTCGIYAADSKDIDEIIGKMIKNANTCDLTPFLAPMYLSHYQLYTIYLTFLNKTKTIDSEGREKIADNSTKLGSENAFISAVNDIVPAMIVDILKAFFWHEFPHGRPAPEELDVLISIITKLRYLTHIDYSILTIPLQSYESFVLNKQFIRKKNPEKKDWLSWKARDIAHALTMRDIFLLLSANYNELCQYAQDPTSPSYARDIFYKADQLTDWLTYQLLTANREKSGAIVKKIIKITYELYKINNIHSLLSFIHALKNSMVLSLIETQIPRDKLKKLKKVSNVICVANYNYFLGNLKEEETRLPILKNIFQKLETVELSNEKVTKTDAIRTAKAFKKISICKREAHYNLKANSYIYDYFSGLPDIPQEVIEDLIFIRKFLQTPKEFLVPKLTLPGAPENSMQFAAYLAQNINWLIIEPLFRAEIYNLPHLIGILNEIKKEERISFLTNKGLSPQDAQKLNAKLFVKIE